MATKTSAKKSENKTKPTAVSVSGYIAALPDETKRADARTLIKMMQKATGEKPKMWGPSIIGFGSQHYVYETGREGDMPIVGFSPRKPALVLYGMGIDREKALAAKLGKYTRGKGCVYIKRLTDVDMKVLEQLVVRNVKDTRAK